MQGSSHQKLVASLLFLIYDTLEPLAIDYEMFSSSDVVPPLSFLDRNTIYIQTQSCQCLCEIPDGLYLCRSMEDFTRMKSPTLS